MLEYINILTMSMLFVGLYIIFANWNVNKSKNNFLLLLMLVTIIVCKLFFITYKNTENIINISYTYECFIILLAIILKLKYISSNKAYKYIYINYFIGLLSIIIYSFDITYLYKQLVSMYLLMTTLYIFYMFNNKSLNRFYKIISILYFMHISASLLLHNTMSLIIVGYCIDLVFSILLINDILKIKISNMIKNNISIVEKIDSQSLSISYREDIFNTNKNITQILNKKLIQKENLLDTILGQSNKCILVIDNNGYIVNESESFSKIWIEYKDYKNELQLKDFLNRNIKKPNQFIKYINEVNELRISIDREIEGTDGRVFKFTYSPCKVIDNNLGVICYIEDITYNKKNEIKIIENEAKYRTIVDNIPYPIVLTDGNRIIYDNHKNENINLKENDITKLILNSSNKGEIIYTTDEIDNIYLNIDREQIIDNESNKQLVVMRDITQYKELLKKVEYSKQKYESLVNLIPEGIYILDFETQALSYANDIFLQMANSASKEEIRLEKISDGMVINSINSNDSIKFCRKTIKNKNNQDIHIECGGMVIDVNKKLKVVGVIRDVTEQVKSEQIEIEIEKKKNEYKNKNEFFVNMSHELKTPINLILSSNQLLESLYKDEVINNNGELANVINTVKQNAHFAMGLIDNIMELCKLEQEFHQYTKDYYNIVDIIEEICINFNEYTVPKGINIIFDTDEEEKILNIDPDDIEKVILTLLSAIIRYSDKNSLISIELKNKDGKEVIEIKNKKGYNYNKYNNDKQRRGLDIAIDVVKQIIELYNGHINIKYSNDNSIIVTVEMIAEKSKEYYKDRVKLIDEEIVYSDYIRMCNF